VPSLNEGFGFTCVEACTMERPVVVSRAGSLPEVVSGRYVTVASGSAAALAEGIHRASQGDYEVSDVKRFSWDDTIERHIRVCEKLLLDRDLAGLEMEPTTGKETD
jgi:glycosyltransferase involved in cell wall biosynthesis